MEFTIVLTHEGAPDPDDDTLADAISDFHATISEHPHGHTEIVLSLSAENISQASQIARAVMRETGLPEPIRVDAMTDEAFDAFHGLDAVTSYLTVAEAATALGVTESAVRQRIQSRSLVATKFGGVWQIPKSALPEREPQPTA